MGDRHAILARRARFVAAALSAFLTSGSAMAQPGGGGAGGAMEEEEPAPDAEAEVCLCACKIPQGAATPDAAMAVGLLGAAFLMRRRRREDEQD